MPFHCLQVWLGMVGTAPYNTENNGYTKNQKKLECCKAANGSTYSEGAFVIVIFHVARVPIATSVNTTALLQTIYVPRRPMPRSCPQMTAALLRLTPILA